VPAGPTALELCSRREGLDLLAMKAREVHLVSNAPGPVRAEQFAIVEAEVPRPGLGQLVVRNKILSIDPFMRARIGGRIPPSGGSALHHRFGGAAIGEVIASTVPRIEAGRLVLSRSGWCELFLADPMDVQVLDIDRVEPSAYLGVLGMPGQTAWAALRKVVAIRPPQTILVSAASGAVGVVAVQIAKASGCRVVACLGSVENGTYLTDALGVDAVVNYRQANLDEQLTNAAPSGVDVFLDNVGGPIFSAGFATMAVHGHIIVCGSMFELDRQEPASLSFDPFVLRSKRLTIETIVVSDFDHCDQEFRHEMTQLLQARRVRNVETRLHGIDSAVPAFVGLFSGASHLGKLVIELDQ
jgi:NADPH-dependent curcumin reductase CurA